MVSTDVCAEDAVTIFVGTLLFLGLFRHRVVVPNWMLRGIRQMSPLVLLQKFLAILRVHLAREKEIR